jgi:type IV pilus assembly protein PilY1
MNFSPNSHRRIAAWMRAVLYAVLSCTVTVSEAASLNLSDTPLYLTTSVEPNIVLTFDDSGSMAWAYLPDTISGLGGNQRACSSQLNKVYYNPNTTYNPPRKADGTDLNATATSFTVAYINGYNTSSGTVNLSTGYRVSWGNLTSYVTCGFASDAGKAAFYYQFTGTDPNINTHYTLVQHNNPTAWTAAQQQNFANWYSYYRNRNLAAKTAAGLAFSLFPTNVRINGQHLNNDDTGNATATARTSGSSNVLFRQAVDRMRRFCDDPTNTDPACTDGSTARTDFFTRLYNSPGRCDGGYCPSTPLRPAMQRAGNHFGEGNTGVNSPYLDVPGTAGTERSCRQNFHILFTDGYWNGAAGLPNNYDGNNQSLPAPSDSGSPYSGITSYTPRAPYTDSWSGTLADNAFYYWFTDLRSGLANNVRTQVSQSYTDKTVEFWDAVNDPASWQHLVTFTVGLGIPGSLTYDTATYNNLVSGTTPWPDPTCATIACQGRNRIDDLWHAAINSRGHYYSAGDPQELTNAFTAIVNNVLGQISSASAVALNSGSITSTSYVYQARFDSGDWTGQLLAYSIDAATGIINTTASWDAADQLDGQHYDTGRNILTFKPSTRAGVSFRWASLDASQQTALNYNPATASYDTQGQARLSYIRGDASNEGANNFYRIRNRNCGAAACPSGTNTGVLGDIVNSAPSYVGAPAFSYPDNIEVQSYNSFKSANSGRTPMVYVGANDGMLHGFNASSGNEVFAYVPSEVYGNLSRLPATPFAHRYFVDGDPVQGDVYINNSWRTILVGSLRKGGQGIFALDITNPASFTEGNASSVVLWEFNDTDDANLGYTYSQPAIAKMQNGKWAVIVGNGYNNRDNDDAQSSTGRATLYILFIENGADGSWSASDFVKIETNAGSTTTPNGLASPAAVDVDGDYIVDYIYAGDLLGNMWKFDVTSSNTNNWTNAANRKVIFTAKDGTNNPQPITVRPEVGRHPAGQAGYMVYFGTGKYLETADASTTGATTQTFYGIWDGSGVNNPGRSDLLQQSVIDTQGNFRVISDNAMVWRAGSPVPNPSYIGWYLDLPTTGERQVTFPVLRGSRIIFTTVIPSDDPCTAGGTGWLMELNASNGGRLDSTPFDVNGDGVFNADDLFTVGTDTVPAGGQKFDGIPSSPAILVGTPGLSPPATTDPNACPDASSECKLLSSSDGSIKKVKEDPDICINCRASWRQLR